MFHRVTARLILRPFRIEDAAAFAAYRSDPDVARYQSWSAPFSIESATALIEPMLGRSRSAIGEWTQVAVEREGSLIGDCAFRLDDAGSATIGFTISRPYWGLGYASEAGAALASELGDRGITILRAECDWENAASRRVLGRLGMKMTGLRSVMFKGRVATEALFERGAGPGP